MCSKALAHSSKPYETRQVAPSVTLAVLSVTGLAQNAWYWLHLPDRVATHFDIQGEPDAWMDKTSATWLMVGFQIGLPWLLMGFVYATRFLPVSLINLPRREYWLHSDRREESLAAIGYWIGWIAALVSLFSMSIGHLTYVANLKGEPLNLVAFGILGGFHLIATLLLVAALYRRFRAPV